MIRTWIFISSAVGGLRDRTDTLIAWAEQRIGSGWYADRAILLGPSNAAARFLLQSPSSDAIGQTLRCWSMSTDPGDPTAWQSMIDAALRQPLRREATPSWAFPAWGGGDDAVDSKTILRQIVNDLFDGWSPDHPSIRGRIGWLENHVDSNLDVDFLTLVASIGRSDVLAEAVCASLGHNPSFILRIANNIPWSRLHPRIQTVIDETMRQASDQWTRTWACAIGQATVKRDTTIDARMFIWRIEPERWNDRDPSIRAALMSSIDPPSHCYGWGVHPDLVARWDLSCDNIFRD